MTMTTAPEGPKIAAQSPPEAQLVNRCAIDIGSGVSKIVIAAVDLTDPFGTTVIQELHTDEESIPFGLDWRENPESGTLSDAITARGLEFFRNRVLPATAKFEVAPSEIRAVGTEVFRRAANGIEFLRSIEEKTGVRVHLIPQEREATLGFLTGVALYRSEEVAVARRRGSVSAGVLTDFRSPRDFFEAARALLAGRAFPGEEQFPLPLSDLSSSSGAGSSSVPGQAQGIQTGDQSLSGEVDHLVVYDSGGGSFQFTHRGKVVLLGNYGVAHAVEDLISTVLADPAHPLARCKEPSLQSSTPNPVSAGQLRKFLEVARRKTFPPDGTPPEDLLSSWRSRSLKFLALAGKNGIMRAAADVVAQHRRGCQVQEHGKAWADFDSALRVFSFTPAELREALFQRLVGRKDGDVEAEFCYFEGAEKAAHVVPKVGSLLVVMEALEMQELHWRPAVGSCLGVLVCRDGAEWGTTGTQSGPGRS